MTHHGFPLMDFARPFPTLQERWYVACKLATDPLYPGVYQVLRETARPLLDVGCGMGLLAFYLRRRGWSPAITGVDFDERKIATASALADGFGSDLAFLQGDVADSLPPHLGSVSALDILQYFPIDARDALLRQCATRVAEDGVLVIRSGIWDESMRFRVTRSVDRIASRVKWIKVQPIRYPRRGELEQVLGGCGLCGCFNPLWGHTPFNSWLGVFRRKPD